MAFFATLFQPLLRRYATLHLDALGPCLGFRFGVKESV